MSTLHDRALTVTRLSAGYPSRRVLRDVSLAAIAPGQVVALVGPNGAGKSTLLRAVAGLIRAEGSIRLGSRELLALPPRSRARYVSFMPQTLPQRVGLTVLEAVIAALRASPLAEHAWGSHALAAEGPRRAMAMLERMGIADIALEPLDHLSGGQRQLASLAQAVVRDPAVLLLDEPTSALDLRHQVIVLDLLRDFAAEGRIVMAVLHDLNMAAARADQLIVLRDGVVEAAAAPAAALTPALLARVYGVRARVERCTRGRLQVLVDEVTADVEDVRSDVAV